MKNNGEKMAAVYLKQGREKSVKQRHPWVFSGAVDHLKGEPEAGETVEVRSIGGDFLGRAAYSPISAIRARMWTWKAEEKVDVDFFRRRLEKAIALRRELVPPEETDALRLVHGESDGLPGLVVDRYGDLLVMQCLSAGVETWREMLADLLVELTGIRQIYERSDVDVRELEGLPQRVGALRGAVESGERVIHENGLRFRVNVLGGQKTGFYVDQRRNRQVVRGLVKDRSVLNCFCYTGAFSVYALAGGAREVLSVDSSADALAAGDLNVKLNGLDAEKSPLDGRGRFLCPCGRCVMRRGSLTPSSWTRPNLHPPRPRRNRPPRGYKDINLLALKLLNPGGLLFTFSCSGGINADLFQKIVAGAALDSGADVSMVQHLHQGPDHPVALNFPEGAYLKGLVCRVGN